jgi:hypothetical protein
MDRNGMVESIGMAWRNRPQYSASVIKQFTLTPKLWSHLQGNLVLTSKPNKPFPMDSVVAFEADRDDRVDIQTEAVQSDRSLVSH